MNVEHDELLGNESEDLSVKHAVQSGAHDAVSTIVQYGVIAGIVAVAGTIILDRKTINKLKQRWL